MKKFRCLKCFNIDKYDDDGFLEEEQRVEVVQGTIWELDDDSFRVAGGEVRLIRNNFWIEISKETFENYFMEVE
ncbi:hypothetical protein ACR77J_12175 [Tissierella praeacuta]|uniref:hypothetical protein n=1 Tax=Tissierella praeacuta TaxID=43131 RepID=UPI0010505D3D|nr:hypothetical protein [Tissierella praeacuta]TCU72883.1 hypothetical protein EV204_105219 [Tissierella praeacuta]